MKAPGGLTHFRPRVTDGAAWPALIRLILLLLTAVVCFCDGTEGPQLAYIGPGAGFAFLGSFLGLLLGFLAAAISFIAWPLRAGWQYLRRGRAIGRGRIRKLILLGLDGLEPRLVERFMEEEKLPAFQRLRNLGCYHRLRTTLPALSPVAWSTFATGVSPAGHNMFDFLSRDPRTYLPELASSRVEAAQRVLRVGRYRIPLGRSRLHNLRKSRSFWSILSSFGIPCTILRVPITFPPEKFNGRLLSAMCTPDLLGTQGTFALFTTRSRPDRYHGGYTHPLKRNGSVLAGTLVGPPNHLVESGGNLSLDFTITPGPESGSAVLRIGGVCSRLRIGEYTPWMRISFRAPFGIKVYGICRFLLLQLEPECSLYVTPVNIDPERPALPISQPSYYAGYLAKLLGPYATLGLAEDTWALNEGVLDADAFLRQAYDIFTEREAMFLSALERTRRGLITCVFDTPDRVQHMFFRGSAQEPSDPSSGAGAVIEHLYRRMDALVARTLDHVGPDTILFVLSDHGFDFFFRGVDLNAWLRENDYLTLEAGVEEGGEGFQGVDWSRTRAYALGLSGIYINLRGREGQGIVDPGAESAALKQELIRRLAGLEDTERMEPAISRVMATDSLYAGPYLDGGPDLLVAYNRGYRVSWGCALGRTGSRVFEDNTRAWGADHCFDPELIPGILLCNRKIDIGDPGLEDLAPTALSLFGLELPAYIEGKPLFQLQRVAAAATRKEGAGQG